MPAHIHIESKEKTDKLSKKGKNKNTTLLDVNAFTDFKLREKLNPTKKSICKINTDRIITKTIVRLRMGRHRGMRIYREGKKHIGNVATIWRQN